jgi:hypothetical protein
MIQAFLILRESTDVIGLRRRAILSGLPGCGYHVLMKRERAARRAPY